MNTYINNRSWSLCAWVKNAVNNSNTCVISLSYGLRLFAGQSTCVSLYNSSRTINCDSSVGTGDNKWHHLVATYNSSNNEIKIYVDGINTGNATYTNGYTYASSWVNGIFIGRDPNNSTANAHYFYQGQMNDVRVYDHALSSKEVEILSRGLVLHYPLNRDGFGQDNLLPGTWSEEVTYTYPASSYSDKYANSTTIVPSASQYTLSFYAKSTVNGDKIRTHYYSPNTTTTCVSSQGVTKTASDGNMDFTLSTNWEFYWVTYTQTETTAVKRVICPRMGSVKDQPGMSGTGIVSIRCIKLEEGNAATQWCPSVNDILYSSLGLNSNVIYDTSGYGNNGTKNGQFSYVSNTQKMCMSTEFNGTDNAIIIPFNNILGTSQRDYTISVWIYKTSIGSKNYQTILGGPSGFELEARNAAETSPVFVGWNWGKPTAPYEFNKWTLFTFVHTTTDCKIYVNGQYVSTGSSKSNPSGNYYIGAWNSTTGQNYQGLMSDFRIYCTALTAEQILELYNTSASLSNNGTLLSYEFVEGGV